jgi:hypothetical protein
MEAKVSASDDKISTVSQVSLPVPAGSSSSQSECSTSYATVEDQRIKEKTQRSSVYKHFSLIVKEKKYKCNYCA